eukprot:scaffold2141_cov282-Pinguiococcus_pyrenoidosus.AAC.33
MAPDRLAVGEPSREQGFPYSCRSGGAETQHFRSLRCQQQHCEEACHSRRRPGHLRRHVQGGSQRINGGQTGPFRAAALPKAGRGSRTSSAWSAQPCIKNGHHQHAITASCGKIVPKPVIRSDEKRNHCTAVRCDGPRANGVHSLMEAFLSSGMQSDWEQRPITSAVQRTHFEERLHLSEYHNFDMI